MPVIVVTPFLSQVESRRGEVSVAELVGLAWVFEASIDNLLWPPESDAPIEIAPGTLLSKRGMLLALLVSSSP